MRWMPILCFTVTINVVAMNACLENIRSKPADPIVYENLHDVIKETADCDLRGAVSCMECVCETIYSFNESSLFSIRSLIEKYETDISSKDWYKDNLKGKNGFRRVNVYRCQNARDESYTGRQIVEIRSSLLDAVSSILESHKSENDKDRKIYDVIKESFDKIKVIKGKNVDDSLKAIGPYLP